MGASSGSRRAAISAEVRADRSRFRADLAAGKRDAVDFRKAVTKEFQLASDIGLAARVKEFRGEVLKAKDDVKALAGEYRKAALAASFGGPISSQITGLKLKEQPRLAAPEAGGPRSYAADIRGGMTAATIQGFQRDTLTANSAALAATGKGATNAGMAMLMLSQSIDDVQYGFRGIVNNIAPLTMALGGGPGLAGVLTIGAVAINQGIQAWDRWNDTTALAEQNADNLAASHQSLARAIEEAGRAGAASGSFLTDRTARQDAGRSGMDQILAREQKLADLQTELRRTEAQRVDGIQRLAAENKIANDAERDRLTKELATTQERLAIDSKQLGDVRREITATKEEIAQIEALGSQQMNADKKRLAYLQGRLPGLTQTASDLDRRGGALFQKSEDIKQQLGPEAAIRKKIQNEALGQEMAKKGVGAVVDFLTRLRENAKAAQSADEQAWRAEKQRREQSRTMEEERSRLEIESLRATGRRGDAKAADELQKKLDLSRETSRLIGQGFSPEDAAAMAGKRASMSSGKKRAGRIQGAISQNLRTGLDGEWHTMGIGALTEGLDYDFEQQRTPLNNQRAAAANRARRARDAGDEKGEASAVAELKVLTAKMDQLIAAVSGTAGDKIKPAATRNN